MKHLTWLSLVLAFTAHNAMAVTTANCPAALQVKYSQFRIEKSLDQVKAAMNQAGYELDAEEDQALTEAYQNVTGVIARLFALSEAANGRCTYKGQDLEKIVLYTEKAQDKLMIQTNIGPRGILLRAYAKVDSVSTTGVYLADAPSAIALAVPRPPYTTYEEGGELIFLGKADSTVVTASGQK